MQENIRPPDCSCAHRLIDAGHSINELRLTIADLHLAHEVLETAGRELTRQAAWAHATCPNQFSRRAVEPLTSPTPPPSLPDEAVSGALSLAIARYESIIRELSSGTDNEL